MSRLGRGVGLLARRPHPLADVRDQRHNICVDWPVKPKSSVRKPQRRLVANEK